MFELNKTDEDIVEDLLDKLDDRLANRVDKGQEFATLEDPVSKCCAEEPLLTRFRKHYISSLAFFNSR